MPSPPTKFGKLVRTRRIATGLTQAELAESAGISERTVSDLERGVRATVYPATARQLAAALRVDDGDLGTFLAAALARPDSRTDRVTPLPADQRSNVPVPLTPLVGRQTEVATIADLVRDPKARLITLIGPGGIGKSRLAVEVALLTRNDFRGGSFFVNLSATDDPAMLIPLVATAVGVRPATGALAVSLAERLSEARVLLVLDTFEHLVAAAPAVTDLLATCPDLTVLATSRAALRLRGEREVPLLPLPVRGPELAAVTLSPAVELFLDRADAVAPATARDAGTRELVADICARVDGLPLAIELAAARVKHMPLTDLLMQLEHRLDALVGGARDLPPRQQTMRATLQWSYQLLDPIQVRLFEALSVFRGGFGRDAAQSVAASRDAAETPELLTTLSALVDSSLVLVEAGASGQARYRMLDVIREYALECAGDSDELEPLRRRHAEYFVTLAELAEPKLRGAEQRAWYSRLSEDEGNFRAALSWAMQIGQRETALRLAASLWMFWRWAGLFDEGRAWLDAALDAGDDCPLDVRCQGLWGAGWLAFHHGDYGRTGQLGARMLGMLDADDNSLRRRNALTLVGNAALGEGRSKDAIAALGEALAVCQGVGTGWHLATSSLNLGTALLHGGRAEDARPWFERALAVYEQLGEQHFAARTLIALGYVRLAIGEREAASALVRRAMEISADLGDAWGIAEGLEATATLRSESAAPSAVTLAGAADRLRERISMRPHPSDARINSLGLERARERLSPQAFEQAWSEGRGLAADTAIGIALT